MKLVGNWKQILAGAWSVRLLVVALIVSAAQVFFSMVSADMIGLDPVWFAAISAIVSAAAIVARVIQQQALSGAVARFMRDESGAMSRRATGVTVAALVAASAAFVAPWEGLRELAYLDIAGIPTVCFGETEGVSIGDVHSPAECRAMLERRVSEFAGGLGKCLKADLPEGTAVAFVSWSYNVGLGAACRSTLVRKANAGDLFGACDELLRWDKARVNGELRRINGLANRRAAERDLCVRSLVAAGQVPTGGA